MDILVNKIENILPKKKIDIFGKNSLMFNTFPYYLLAVIYPLSAFGNLSTAFIFLYVIYGIIPLLD